MAETVPRTSIKAKLYKKISKNLTDFCIFLCSTTDYTNLPATIKKSGNKTYITVTGTNLPSIESVEIEYFGQWITNKKYGVQFRADSYMFVQPETETGIKAFLKSKAFPGVGSKTAELIVEQFGKKTLEVIKNTPNSLLMISGITPSKVVSIVTSYKKNASLSDVTVFLAQYGISSDSIIKIHDIYGSDTVDKIKENPYIIQDVRGIGFRTCDRIARGLNSSLDSYPRVKGGVIDTIYSHMANTGDTCIEVKELQLKTLSLLNEGFNPKPVSEELFKAVVKQMANEEIIVFRKKNYVFFKEQDNAEEYSSTKIKNLLAHKGLKPTTLVKKVINEYANSTKFKLTQNQLNAVELSLNNRFSVITGGPGSGKTSILFAIIECYKSLYPLNEVILLAPTGKAARRMEETTGHPASTIHSKLKVYDSTSSYIPEALPEGLIVVDESSMIDNFILYKLMQSIQLNSSVIFVGDVDQLPSVNSGNVLSELIESKVVPVSRLTQIFRQEKGGSILDNAIAINSGETTLRYDEFFSLIEANNEEEALEKIKNCYLSKVNKYGIDNVTLLSPLRRSQGGRLLVVADELNDVIQEAINPRVGNLYCNLYNTEYRVGDKVMQWKNKEFSSNGDIGKITYIAEDDGDFQISIKWENGNKTTENRLSMADISLAYAISVHKSQGSQYSAIILPLMSVQKCQLLNKRMLFTGLTRSKVDVTIISDNCAEMVEYCVKNTGNNRITLLAERLKNSH